MIRCFLSLLLACTCAAQSYRVETIRVPTDIRLEVGGMAFWPDGTLVMCTRRGEIWLYAKQRFERFAFGLHEPLGLWADTTGEAWVVQRGELSRIRDTDGDRKADAFDTICQDWGYTGNYHQYAFGLARDKDGSFFGTLGLGFYKGGDRFKGSWLGTRDDIKHRGWVFRVTPDGKFDPFAPGVRAPNGIGISPDGDLFVTDNQGSYVACGYLVHVERGDFLGHPSGLVDDPRFPEPWKLPPAELAARRKRPAVYLPHGVMGNSTSQPIWDTTKGKFGPFAGQAIVGEVQNGKLARVALERVGGVVQGSCMPFLHGRLGGGANRLVFDKQGVLWLGFTGRGWAAGEGLKRITYTGKPPSTIHSVRLTANGFALRFTVPLRAREAQAPESYSVNHFELAWQARYNTAPSKRTIVKPTRIQLSEDRRVVQIELPELQASKIYELDFAALRTAGGKPLEENRAYYTLNKLRQ